MSTERLVIIGSGPAGLTAGIYAGRANLSPLIIDGSDPGGQLMTTTYVENWPGETSILGPELMKNMREHAAHYKARFLMDTITNVDLSQRPFELTTKRGNVYTHALIIATGAKPKRLRCPGEDTYWNKGVTTCAVCDGAFYKDKSVVVIGGGDTAMENASFLTNFTDKITIVHILDELTASQAMKERVLNNPKIQIIYNSTVTAIEGNGKMVTGVTITNQQSKEISDLAVDGVFLAIGLTPNTQLFKDQLAMNNYGYLLLKEHTSTSVSGVFAAGDVADSRYRQAITAAGTGCAASLDAERYLKEHGF
jgi:thioredoxin reductase (NADPH)